MMAIISSIIRQLYLPNPFEALGDGIIMNISGNNVFLTPVLLNWIAEPFMHLITYSIVGLLYRKGSDPEKGSALYLLFYCLNTFFLWIMSLGRFKFWIIGIVVYICFYDNLLKKHNLKV